MVKIHLEPEVLVALNSVVELVELRGQEPLLVEVLVCWVMEDKVDCGKLHLVVVAEAATGAEAAVETTVVAPEPMVAEAEVLVHP
jgi:hypothetical protein